MERGMKINIKWLLRLVGSSIGRKFLMAVTGLGLCGFVLVHLAGNLLLFKGQAAYDHYAGLLLSNPLITYAELGLAAMFLVHVTTGIWVRWEDWKCRPVGYVKRKWSSGGRTPGSATMLYTAAALLVFLAYHLRVFRFVDHSEGFYMMVTGAFRHPEVAAFYVLVSVTIVLHLSHGFQSAFQTLGISHPKYAPLIKFAGLAVAAAMIGFATIPLWFLLVL